MNCLLIILLLYELKNVWHSAKVLFSFFILYGRFKFFGKSHSKKNFIANNVFFLCKKTMSFVIKFESKSNEFFQSEMRDELRARAMWCGVEREIFGTNSPKTPTPLARDSQNCGWDNCFPHLVVRVV